MNAGVAFFYIFNILYQILPYNLAEALSINIILLTCRYTLDHLINKKGFNLVSVPDLLHPEIIRACGMEVQGERTQVFRLDPNLFGQVALSGTAEMAFGGLFLNKSIKFNHSKTHFSQEN